MLWLIVAPSTAATSFSVVMDPPSIAIPMSYDFPVACTVASSKPLTAYKNFTWTSSSAGIISSFDSSQGTKGSTATVRSSTPGTYTVSCQVNVIVPGDEPVIKKNSSTIQVLGKSYY